MMFLQYAVWGVWLPVLATYLQSSVADGGMGFTSGQVGLIIGVAGSVGAVSALSLPASLPTAILRLKNFWQPSSCWAASLR